MIQNEWVVYGIVFLSQILLAVIRIIDIKATYNNQNHLSVIMGIIGSSTWFLSSAVSIFKFMEDRDILILLLFVLSGAIGRYLGFWLDKKLNDKKLSNKGLFHTLLMRRF